MELWELAKVRDEDRLRQQEDLRELAAARSEDNMQCSLQMGAMRTQIDVLAQGLRQLHSEAAVLRERQALNVGQLATTSETMEEVADTLRELAIAEPFTGAYSELRRLIRHFSDLAWELWQPSGFRLEARGGTPPMTQSSQGDRKAGLTAA